MTKNVYMLKSVQNAGKPAYGLGLNDRDAARYALALQNAKAALALAARGQYEDALSAMRVGGNFARDFGQTEEVAS